jgi:uracil permease
VATKGQKQTPKNKGIKKAQPAKKTVTPKKTTATAAKKATTKPAKKTTKDTAKKVTVAIEQPVKKSEKVDTKKIVSAAETRNKKMLYDVDETPPMGKWIILAIQHVFAMFGATILVPILVNGACGEEVLPIPVALIAAGVVTLIYIFCTKRKSPVFLGSSFAFIAPMIAGYSIAGAAGVYTGLVVAGLVYVVAAIAIKVAGKGWIDKLLPPVIIGPMIIIIGLSLASAAIGNIGIDGIAELEWKNVVVAAVSLLVTAVVAMYAKGFFKIIPFLSGIVAGYIVACCFGMVNFDAVADAKFFEMPNFKFIFNDWQPHFGALLTIAPVALVTMCEHIGDHTALGTIIGKDLLKDPGLDRTLVGDGVATAVSAMMGGPANTTYGENTSVVGITKIASVSVIGLAAIIAIVFGFLGKLTALINTLPAPVLGGVSILLYGFIAVNGLKVLIKHQVDFEKTKNVIVASTMLVLAIGGAVIAINSGDFSLTIEGMSLAAIIGVLLNLVLPDKESSAV